MRGYGKEGYVGQQDVEGGKGGQQKGIRGGGGREETRRRRKGGISPPRSFSKSWRLYTVDHLTKRLTKEISSGFCFIADVGGKN